MSPSSISSTIRSFVVVLSALSYATAQVPMGVQMVPNPMISGNGSLSSMMPGNSNPNSMMSSNGSLNSMMPGNSNPNSMMSGNGNPNSMMSSNGSPSSMMQGNGSPNSMMPGNTNPSPSNPYPGYSGSDMSSMLPAETGTPAYGSPPSQYTPPPSQSSDPHQMMPYSSFTNGGYSQMNCGYGYQKGSDGMCYPESWWGQSNTWGCYETIIINNDYTQQYCPPPSTMTVTDTYTSIETQFLTVTCTETLPTTVFSTLTMTDFKTDTMFLTNTETLPVTVTSTSLLVESTILTKTDTLMETYTDFVTKTELSLIPTTYTSIWVSTDVIDRTNTIELTLTSTCTDSVTLTNTLTYLSTFTKTDTSTLLSVSTSTTTQLNQETGLADCLYSCNQYKYLTTGNSNQWNTYASPPVYTPAPSYQPYQSMSQGGGYSMPQGGYNSQGSGY